MPGKKLVEDRPSLQTSTSRQPEEAVSHTQAGGNQQAQVQLRGRTGAAAGASAGPAVDEAALQQVVDAVLEVVPKGQKTSARVHVPHILRQCFQKKLRNPNQVAYMLGTGEHESKLGGLLVEGRRAFEKDDSVTEENEDQRLSLIHISEPTRPY